MNEETARRLCLFSLASRRARNNPPSTLATSQTCPRHKGRGFNVSSQPTPPLSFSVASLQLQASIHVIRAHRSSLCVCADGSLHPLLLVSSFNGSGSRADCDAKKTTHKTAGFYFSIEIIHLLFIHFNSCAYVRPSVPTRRHAADAPVDRTCGRHDARRAPITRKRSNGQRNLLTSHSNRTATAFFIIHFSCLSRYSERLAKTRPTRPTKACAAVAR